MRCGAPPHCVATPSEADGGEVARCLGVKGSLEGGGPEPGNGEGIGTINGH